MKIAVCDDEKYFRDEVKDIVYTYSNKHRLDIVIDEYLCGEDLLNAPDVKYDMILLDYQMGELNGLETAKALRKRNIDCIIIFITSHPDVVYDAFEVSAYRFLTKPLDAAKLTKALDDYFSAYGSDYSVLLKFDRSTVCVQVRDIVYLEADNKKCYVRLTDGEYHCSKAMTTIASVLPDNIFYRVHNAYIVNFNYILSYDNKSIRLRNGAIVHMSRKYFPQFKNAYRAFAKDRDI